MKSMVVGTFIMWNVENMEHVCTLFFGLISVLVSGSGSIRGGA